MSVHRNEVRAGLLLLIALGVLTVGMLALAGSGNLFRETREVTVLFANARGVREGDPVRFAGLKVGEVERLGIRVGDGTEAPRIEVVLTLPGDLVVPGDSRVRVTETLTGSRIIELLPGIGQPLAAGEEIHDLREPVGLDDLADRAEGLASGATKAVDEAGALIARLGAVVGRIEKGLEGERIKSIFDNIDASSKDIAEATGGVKATLAEVGPILTEAAEALRHVGQEASAMVEESRPEVAGILARVREAVDGVSSLVSGPEAPVAKTVAQIGSAAERLEKVLDGFESTGQEASELLASSRPRVMDILDRLKTTGTNLKAASEDLRAHPWKLLNEPEQEDQRVQQIFNAARNFNSGAEALSEATRALELATRRSPEGGPEVRALIEKLTQSYDRYAKAEDLFWKALREGGR